jgi:probable F420-dependent oxidoreductase
VKFALYALHRGENAQPDRMRASALTAERAGFEALWVGDHIALPRDAPDPFDEPRLEAISTLAYLAAVTSRIRLGVAVLVLPQRQPVLLAKQLTTVDVLSAGRLTVGVGVGYLAAELAAFGVALSDRGSMTDEFLQVLQELWSHRDRHVGRWVSFDGVLQYPVPAQRPHPPIVVGGHARAGLERPVRVGDGWFGWGLSVDDTRDAVRTLHDLRRQQGVDSDSPFEISIVADRPVTPELAERYAAVGVDRLVLVPPAMTAESTDAVIDRAASELIPTSR